MKKQLLSFSALVAVGLLAVSGPALAEAKKASKPTLKISGYTVQGLRYTDDGDGVGGKNTGGLAQFSDSEIFFNVTATLDNGIQIKGNWQLEGSGLSEDGTMDEHSVSFLGSFGTLKLGQADGAPAMMVTGYQGSWATGNSLNLAFDRQMLIPAPSGFQAGGAGFSVQQTLGDGDDNKITYITPRVAGFQVGASYVRDPSQGSNNVIDQSATAAANYEHWFGIATNYVRTFGDMKVGVAGAYLHMSSSAAQLTAAKDGKQFADDPEGFGLGLSVETGPFKVSIGYNETNDWLASATVSNSGSSWDVGARYTMGPHKFGIAYFTGAVEGTTTTVGEDESETLWLTHSFTVGPGVAWQNTLGWADWDGEGGSTAALDNDGWGFATHMKINF